MKTKLSFLIAVFLFADFSGAATQKKKAKTKAKPKSVAAKAAVKSGPAVASYSSNYKAQLQKALDLAKSGQNQAAAAQLFSLGRRGELKEERAQIKYILGLMLMELKLNQVAAFQFVDVIRTGNPKYTKLAVEKLSIVADGLGDDTLLNYAIKKVNLSDIAPKNRDMIYFRIGEVRMRNRDFKGAESAFASVQYGSSYYNQALFNRGNALLHLNQYESAEEAFRQLISAREKSPVTDTNKVAAKLALARTYYQHHDWDEAIEAYSNIPRDHILWHDALFEQTWAMLRAARFRSALSNFQSLHSAYYQDFYNPESLLLRSIVYLYICKYDEMEKVLQLFERTYGPVSVRLRDFLKGGSDSLEYFQEADRGLQFKKGKSDISTKRLPYIVVKSVLEEGDVKRAFTYLKSLEDEKAKIDGATAFKNSTLGKYALKIIFNRRKNTQLAIGDMVKNHLNSMRVELRDLYEQASFIRYEMINGKKEVIKTKLAGKALTEDTVDKNVDRSFYVQNGYEYYPFQGEFWLDEIGNYHYLGKQNCE